MYISKEKIYADAGKYLIGNKSKGFSGYQEYGPYTERFLDLSNLTINDKYIYFDEIRWDNPGIHSYSDIKKYIVHKRYSNDDQIAIMLNKDDSEEDALAYEKMQEWREWASVLARKIMEIINK